MMRLSPLLKTITKLLFTAILIGSLQSSYIYSQTTPPDQLNVGITEHLNAHVPLNLIFTGQDGNSKPLSDFVDGVRPTIVTLVYYNCPMLCNMILTGLTKSLVELQMTPGKDYNVLSVSIDPTNTTQQALDTKQKYMRELGWLPNQYPYWNFLVSPDNQVQRLADALGYRYERIDSNGEYAHGSAIFVLSPTGKISRYLYGIEFKPFDVKLSILEAKKEKSKTTVESMLLFCYNYDPDSRSYVLQARNVMKIGGLITIALVVLLYLWIFRSKKQRKN